MARGAPRQPMFKFEHQKSDAKAIRGALVQFGSLVGDLRGGLTATAE
jgi:hypothetical protein